MAGSPLAQVRTRANSVFSGFTNGQKAMLLVSVVAVIAGAVMFSSWASQPDYGVLYANLSPADAGAVQQKLTEAKVPVQLSAGGTTIMVPQDMVNKARVDMATAGLPANSKGGWDTFDKMSLTSSTLQQNVALQRALEGEISKAIEAMDSVSAAQVHLAIPRDDVFAETQKQAKAAVVVTVKPGQKLTNQQVSAIVNMTASAVDNLPSDNVTVSDTSGRVLKGPGGEFSAAGSGGSDRAQQKAGYETELETKLTNQLETLVGPGNARVVVNADMNYDKTTTTRETNTVQQTPVPNPISAQTSTETLAGGGTTVGGTLGGVAGGAAGTNNNYNKSSSSVLNPWETTKSQVDAAPGKVDRLTVSVLLNSKTAQAFSEATDITPLVSSAVGLDPARGDQITVKSLNFDETAQKTQDDQAKVAEAAKSADAMLDTATAVAMIIAALIILLMIRKSLRGPKIKAAGKKKKGKDANIDLSALEASSDELKALASAQDALDAADAAHAALPSGPTPEELERMRELEERRANLRSEVSEFIEHQPEEVAQLLRSWLADRRG